MLAKLCRDGLLYALALYLTIGVSIGFDLTHWPVGLRWMLPATWAVVMWCLAGMYRARAKQARAREAGPPQDCE